ncbi:hypothetical protein F4804DRAFT_326910 [Jackrogersella minutella]|nr:hypothetical protein F4804DRAFT_326910 [Jackrogersella minutella]
MVKPDLDDEAVVAPWMGYESVRLLETCKQIYYEAAPIVFEKMSIGGNLDEWKIFLNKIGPLNISMVRHLDLTYSCSTDNSYQQCLRHQEKQYDLWAGVLEPWKRAQPYSNLRTLTINISPCEGHWDCGDDSAIADDDEYDDECFGINHYNTKYENCRVFRDIAFFKHLLVFVNVHEIVLKNRFNPLSAIFLRKRLDFTAKRDQHGGITLVNRTHPFCNDGVDLRGYEPSGIEEVYDKVIVAEPENKAAYNEEPGNADEFTLSWDEVDPTLVDSFTSEWA